MRESYYAKKFESMLGAMHYSMDKQEDGNYAVYNSQSRSYISSGDDIRSFENAKEVTEHINAVIGKEIVDKTHEAIADILYETYKTDLSILSDKLKEFSSIVNVDEIDKYIEKHPDVRDKLWEKDYGNNVGYLDLLANHLDDVKLDYLFDKKFYDDIEVIRHHNEPIIYNEKDNTINVFFDTGTEILTELLRNTEFEFGEQTEAVKYAGKKIDPEAADIKLWDLYVDFDTENAKAFQLTITNSDGLEKDYFSNSEGADRMKITPEIEKAVVNAVEQFSGKSLEETINDFRKECDKELV